MAFLKLILLQWRRHRSSVHAHLLDLSKFYFKDSYCFVGLFIIKGCLAMRTKMWSAQAVPFIPSFNVGLMGIICESIINQKDKVFSNTLFNYVVDKQLVLKYQFQALRNLY